MSANNPATKTLIELLKILKPDPKAKATWDDLTPLARRDFVTWIESAKQPETRARRLESVPSRLLSGKRRPCCYAMVPMNLYRTLTSLPKAKKQWAGLSPDEKRDFVAWVDAVSDKDENQKRVEKTCAMLLNGKRHP